MHFNVDILFITFDIRIYNYLDNLASRLGISMLWQTDRIHTHTLPPFTGIELAPSDTHSESYRFISLSSKHSLVFTLIHTHLKPRIPHLHLRRRRSPPIRTVIRITPIPIHPHVQAQNRRGTHNLLRCYMEVSSSLLLRTSTQPHKSKKVLHTYIPSRSIAPPHFCFASFISQGISSLMNINLRSEYHNEIWLRSFVRVWRRLRRVRISSSLDRR